MSKQKFTVALSANDVKKLKSIISKGVCSARSIKRAQILLNLNDAAKNKYKTSELAKLFDISETSITIIKKSYLLDFTDNKSQYYVIKDFKRLCDSFH